ncbi:MAG TPA: hypothetical protein EYN66_15790 [Myxococcales bacterium]|nr:hypothetical protein [Myxococcales bacterium]
MALNGNGGDELFMGYPTFPAHKTARLAEKVPSALRRSLLKPLVQALPVSENNWSFDFKLKRFLAGLDLPAFARHFAWIGGTHPHDQDALLEPSVYAAAAPNPLDDVDRLLLGWNSNDELDKLTYLYARLYLAEGVLQKVDRATMSYALECRLFLLAPNVVNCAMAIPSHLKIHKNQSKWILREALKKRLPQSILERPKKGFGIPLTSWLKGPLLPLCKEILTDPSLRTQALFKKESCEKLINEHVNGWRDHRKTLWALMVYQLWEQGRP